jgi:hypothetical protein
MNLPPIYQTLWDDGVMQLYGPGDRAPLMSDAEWDSWLQDRYLNGPPKLLFSDIEWLSPLEIATWDYGYGRRRELIPFATNARMDVYAWYLPWSEDQQWPVVFSPREELDATGYAPDFEGFLFRAFLEECSGSWLGESFGIENVARLLERSLSAVSCHLSEGGTELIRDLLSRPTRSDEPDIFATITEQEATETARRILAFEHFDELVMAKRDDW